MKIHVSTNSIDVLIKVIEISILQKNSYLDGMCSGGFGVGVNKLGERICLCKGEECSKYSGSLE